MTDLELMSIHCDAAYVQNDRAELVCINDWLRRPAPALWLGFTQKGTLWRFRQDVPADIRVRVEHFIDRETVSGDNRLPLHHETYRQLLRADDTVAGPTYWLRALAPATSARVERVSEASAVLLRDSELEAWIPDIPFQQPMFASLEDDRAVAVCASVRTTSVAHAAGVETLPSHRRQGHATAVVAAWAQGLQRADVVPLYSTSWDNLASQGVAERLGFEAFGWEYRVG